MKSISIVIPAYNEESLILTTLEKIADYLHRKRYDYEIIVVDDGSDDHTVQRVKEFRNSNIRIMENSRNRGKGYAVQQGILAAEKDWILLTDADLSIPMGELERFFQNTDYEILIGSRAVKNCKILIHQPFYREMGGRLLNVFIQLLVIPGIWDTQCGFKLFTKGAAKRIFRKQTIDGFGFDVEVLYLARKYGYKILELPVMLSHHPATKVKVFRDGLKILADLVKIRMNDLKDVYK